MRPQWIVICVALGLTLLVVVAAVQGFTPWTVLLVVLLVACPLIGVWVMRQTRDFRRRNETHAGHVD